MPIPAPPTLSNPPTAPTRADPATFAARGDAFLSWFATAWNNLSASMAWIAARAQEVFDQSNATQLARDAAVAAQNDANVKNAAANAAAAAQAKLDAQAYATLAQATNPDAPVRLNPRRITAATTIPAGYNAATTGPITVADGITVTVSDHSTWSIQ